jgi:NAD(P) transhydrogenase subunit alpha
VIDGAAEYGRALPMMTAAGTVPAARCSSWAPASPACSDRDRAPARRRGYGDRRAPAAKEQVESLGAKFIAVEDEEFKQAETAAGYARRCRRSIRPSRPALVAEHQKQDIVVTTALIQAGRRRG